MKSETAFPTGIVTNEKGIIIGGSNGMTLRDYFAAKAMQSFMYQTGIYNDQSWFDEISETSYRVADAMMKARETK